MIVLPLATSNRTITWSQIQSDSELLSFQPLLHFEWLKCSNYQFEHSNWCRSSDRIGKVNSPLNLPLVTEKRIQSDGNSNYKGLEWDNYYCITKQYDHSRIFLLTWWHLSCKYFPRNNTHVHHGSGKVLYFRKKKRTRKSSLKLHLKHFSELGVAVLEKFFEEIIRPIRFAHLRNWSVEVSKRIDFVDMWEAKCWHVRREMLPCEKENVAMNEIQMNEW